MIGADRREYFCRAASICPAELRVMPLSSMLLICHVNLNAGIAIYNAFGTYIQFLPPFPMVRKALFRPPQHSLPLSSTIPALFKSLIRATLCCPAYLSIHKMLNLTRFSIQYRSSLPLVDNPYCSFRPEPSLSRELAKVRPLQIPSTSVSDLNFKP